MTFLRTFTITAALASALSAFAQAPAANPGDWMMKMDQHMTAMRGVHDRMASARTPEERNALMNEQMKLMQGGMNMMGGMGPGAMGGAGMGMGGMGAGAMGMGAKPGGAASAPDMATRQQMMEKRMEMMQSMMQMMIDRMPSAPAKK